MFRIRFLRIELVVIVAGYIGWRSEGWFLVSMLIGRNKLDIEFIPPDTF